MADGLDVIIVDDESEVCELVSDSMRRFYTWGDILVFTDVDKAIQYCLSCDVGIAVFIVDVFLTGKNGFFFLDEVEKKFPSAHEDAIIITGNANDDIVNMCIASNVNYLLEKPIRPYALQLSVRAIVSKYIRFSRKLLHDPDFAEIVSHVY